MANTHQLASYLEPPPEGASTLTSSLAHASKMYDGCYIDDSNGPAVALILAVLSENAEVFVEWMEGAHATLSYHLADGVEALNSVTASPYPSFETEREARAYIQTMRTATEALKLAFENGETK